MICTLRSCDAAKRYFPTQCRCLMLSQQPDMVVLTFPVWVSYIQTRGWVLSFPFAYPTASVSPFGEYCAERIKFLQVPVNRLSGFDVPSTSLRSCFESIL